MRELIELTMNWLDERRFFRVTVVVLSQQVLELLFRWSGVQVHRNTPPHRDREWIRLILPRPPLPEEAKRKGTLLRQSQGGVRRPGLPVMLAKLKTFALVGIDAVPVEAEVDISPGLPKTVLVGLPELAVKESACEDRQAAENLDECGHPGRHLRQRRMDLVEQLGEPRRPPAELGPPVSHEAVSDHQAKRQRCPLSPKRFMWQFEHFGLPSVCERVR
jgi:hypothetical protein